jgi:hypothetical protein
MSRKPILHPVCTGLFKDTFEALERSTKDLIHYSLETLSQNYVLCGKFQTDNLERRVGKYRRLSGCNYNVSFQEILEYETKFRVRQVLELARNDELSIKSLSSHSFDEGISGIDNSILQ